jgi:hypothetical protein
MAPPKTPEPAGFRPIEVSITPDETFRPIEVGPVAAPVAAPPALKPAAGEKEE